MDNKHLFVLSGSRCIKDPNIQTIITENVIQHEEKPTKLFFKLFHKNQQKTVKSLKLKVLHIHQHYTGHHS